ncbi:MAG: hypothetical protein OXU61_09900, partial [Gammaproteobacteria bacterium]|nr:hypothetical protein [Gammaproteobacteria bacterium]
NDSAGVVCPTCSNVIKDATSECEGQEALFCEGTCHCWYHRWCVGVSSVRFQPLSESSEPFLCPACTSQQQQKTIQELQSCVQALTGEILELKAAVCGLQKTVVVGASSATSRETQEEGSAGEGKLPWNIVVSKGRVKGNRKGDRKNQGSGGTAHIPCTHNPNSAQSHKHAATGADVKKKEVLAGVRRVWGTMKACTVPTVIRSITRLTDVGSNIQVKSIKLTMMVKLLDGGTYFMQRKPS